MCDKAQGIHMFGFCHCFWEIIKTMIQILNCYLITDIEIRCAGTSGSNIQAPEKKGGVDGHP